MSKTYESASLPEIECIEVLEAIDIAYTKRFGASPYNISHWDPSDDFTTKMLPYLELPSFLSPLSYSFSYQLAETDLVVSKLGGLSEVHGSLITPSTTTSILCVLNWLKRRGARQIITMCPTYFSLSHACSRFGLKLKRVYMKRTDHGFSLPLNGSRTWKEPSVLWITSPVYSSGTYFSASDVDFIRSLLKSGWIVVADECLALPGTELIRALGPHSRFISIYSPHKCVCVNGVKFSAVIFNKKHLGFMERWADVWYGGLSCSSLIAMAHFLSPNFDSYLAHFQKTITRERQFFDKLCVQLQVQTDTEAKGHFVSCYYPTISSRMGNSRSFLEKLVHVTGGAIIPGNRSRFGRDVGFSFRVNLTRSGPQFRPALARIIGHVNAYAD